MMVVTLGLDDGCAVPFRFTYLLVCFCSPLVKPGTSQLNLNLNYKVDYMAVTPRAWTALSSWYSSTHVLDRTVVISMFDTPVHGSALSSTQRAKGGQGRKKVEKVEKKEEEEGTAELELYPLNLKLFRLNKEGQVREDVMSITISKVSPSCGEQAPVVI